jgi:hypothetical protein
MDEFLISILEEENPDNMVFQLEEAPPHFAWPYPPWFFSFGHTSGMLCMCQLLCQNFGEIRAAAATVTLDLLNNMWTETEYIISAKLLTVS